MENKETIIENDVKICLFMGGVEIAPAHYFVEERKTYFLPDEMKYHESWDWLMPVVEKICRMGEPGDNFCLRTFGMINDENGQMMVRFDRFSLFEATTLIEALYMAVIAFIDWHNSQNTKEQ
jgi:hypothetical protein